jgi:hypothetical protein
MKFHFETGEQIEKPLFSKIVGLALNHKRPERLELTSEEFLSISQNQSYLKSLQRSILGKIYIS